MPRSRRDHAVGPIAAGMKLRPDLARLVRCSAPGGYPPANVRIGDDPLDGALIEARSGRW